jgi:hypothetical protein
MAADSSSSPRTLQIWVVVLIALVLLSFLAMRRSVGKAAQMKAEAAGGSTVAQLKVGDETKVVIEVTGVSANLEGNLLEKQTETVYRRSGSTIKIAFNAATPVVMGKASDVHTGAVVHVTAKMADDRRLQASQIVVLTGYVKVQ